MRILCIVLITYDVLKVSICFMSVFVISVNIIFRINALNITTHTHTNACTHVEDYKLY